MRLKLIVALAKTILPRSGATVADSIGELEKCRLAYARAKLNGPEEMRGYFARMEKKYEGHVRVMVDLPPNIGLPTWGKKLTPLAVEACEELDLVVTARQEGLLPR